MRTATAVLKSISPYSQSRHHGIVRDQKEGFDDFEKRTWRERMHVNSEGHVLIPPTSLKNCLSEAAKYISMKIPGKGKATFTKHFEAGILVVEPIVLPVSSSDVEGEWLFLPADGRRGSGNRVMKCYPKIESWTGSATFFVLDEIVTKEAFEYHLGQAGSFIGIGRFRPRNNGFYGRFSVESVKWS